jgi:cytohesin
MMNKFIALFLVCMSTLLVSMEQQPPRVKSKHYLRFSTEMGDADKVLLNAAARGNADEVNRALKAGAHIDAQNHYGRTALHCASEQGYESCVKVLLDAHARPIGDELDTTPLHQASYYNHLSVVIMLLKAGHDREALSQKDLTPLHCAAKNGSAAVVALLLLWGANIKALDIQKKTHLHWAAASGDVDTVHLLLAAGSDIRAVTVDGNMPLHSASIQGHDKVVKILLEAGAPKDVGAHYGDTPLHQAVDEGHVNVVKLLLEAGCDKDACAQHQYTPLHCAARANRNDVITLLLKAGCNKEVIYDGYKTPLYLAVEEGKLESVRALCEAGADVNFVNDRGHSILLCAVHVGNYDILRDLLSQPELNINALLPDDATAVNFALENGIMQAAMLLLGHGATATTEEIIDGLSGNVLYLAAALGNLELFETALKNNPLLDELQLQVVFDCAAARGHVALVARLFAYPVGFDGAFKIVKKILNESGLDEEARERYQRILKIFIAHMPLKDQILENREIASRLRAGYSQLPFDLRRRIELTPNERLIAEIRIGQIDGVYQALQAGADNNVCDSEKRSALELAALYENEQLAEGMVKVLLIGKRFHVLDDEQTRRALLGNLVQRPQIVHLIQEALHQRGLGRTREILTMQQ